MKCAKILTKLALFGLDYLKKIKSYEFFTSNCYNTARLEFCYLFVKMINWFWSMQFALRDASV